MQYPVFEVIMKSIIILGFLIIPPLAIYECTQEKPYEILCIKNIEYAQSNSGLSGNLFLLRDKNEKPISCSAKD
jgi:hypothetical protein